MSKQWTDEDVARMLGWKLVDGTDIVQPAYEVDGKLIWWQRLCFGLSTPPSADADANAARYVLPWLRSRGAYLDVEMMDGFNINVSFQEDGMDLAGASGEFSTALCTAALEAYHAGRN